MFRTITCPACSNRGSAAAGSDAFEIRGVWQRMPVRKCSRCGAGMTVHPRLTGAKAKLIPSEQWVEMEHAWELEFGPRHEESADNVDRL